MDLNSLLNDQNDNTISLSTLKSLLEQNDSAKTLDKIRTCTTYIYPNNQKDTFVFFDYFIRVVLSALAEDDPYSAQYARSIIIHSLRTCIKGLTEENDMIWLTQFSHYFTRQTWAALHDNMIILAYLYGLVLALLKEPEIIQGSNAWSMGFFQFMQSDIAVVLCHIWLYCCIYLDDKEELGQGDTQQSFFRCLESNLQQHTVSTATLVEMLTIMKEGKADYVLAQLDGFWGSGLLRSPFTEDEVKLGLVYFRENCKRQSYQYSAISKAFSLFDMQPEFVKSEQNKLVHPDLLSPIPSDKFAQTRVIRKGTCFWIEQMSTLLPDQFDLLLKSAILDNYPTDKKSVLDLVIADWTLRDRFHRHMNLVVKAILSQFETKKYNIRISPYYAFIQLFNLSENQLQQPEQQQQQQQQEQQQQQQNTLEYNSATTYQVKSGAYIDLSQFRNYSDTTLIQGCCLFLQNITLSVANTTHHQAHEWLADCLKSANASIIQSYAAWLAAGLERDLQQSTSSGYAEFMLTLLTTCVAQSAHIVPTLLLNFSDQGLSWLLTSNRSSATILLHYFDDGSQVSKDMVVTDMLKTKTKKFVDMLLGYLRENMSGIDPKAPHSRVWFQNHFLGNILTLVGEEDQADTSVASQLFRQFFKTRDDFEWYFGTPLLQQMTANSLDLANVHEIYAVKSTGLAAMFQEMVRLGDHVKKERLIQIWSDLWMANKTFTVPVSWVLQCAGLYNQAPVLIKQMIKRFVSMGLQQQPHAAMLPISSNRNFLDRMMDLVLLSDAPEPDSLFELILEIAYENNDLASVFEQINLNIINILIELAEELELESKASADTVPLQKAEKKRNRRQMRKLRRGGKLSHNKLRSMMRKHEEILERYLLQSSSQSLKALTTLVQRLFNFLLRLLNSSLSHSAVDSNNSSLAIKQDIQKQLMSIPLFYEPLSKLVKLIRQPEDLQEDIQTVIDLSTEYLKHLPDKTLFEATQRILGY